MLELVVGPGAPEAPAEAEIIAAGRRLQDRGEAVNGWTLRRELGEFGQPEALLRVWEAAHVRPAPPPEPGTLGKLDSAAVAAAAARAQSALAEAIGAACASIQAEAEARYGQAHAALAAQREAVAAELRLANASLAAADAQRADLVARLEELAGQLQAREAEAARLRDRVLAEDRNEAARRHSLAAAEGEVAHALARLAEAEAALARQREAEAQLRTTHAAELARLREELSARLDAEEELARLRAALEATATEREAARAETMAQRDRARRLERDLAISEASLATLREQVRQEATHKQGLNRQLEELQEAWATASRSAAEANDRAEQAERHADRAEALLAEANRRRQRGGFWRGLFGSRRPLPTGLPAR